MSVPAPTDPWCLFLSSASYSHLPKDFLTLTRRERRRFDRLFGRLQYPGLIEGLEQLTNA